jgi:HEAT repeat protein
MPEELHEQGSEPETMADSEPETSAEQEDYQKRFSFYLRNLEDENVGVRWKAVESLGRLGDPAAVDPLIEMLWDDDERVRLKAAWALGQIGDPRALPPLQRLYRMEIDNVKEIIEEAIKAIHERMENLS